MMCCEKRSSSVGVIMYFCLVSQERKHFHLNSALIQFGETSMLDIGRGYDSVVWARVWSLKEGKKMCHIYTHYLT